jgi:hypothetical protein
MNIKDIRYMNLMRDYDLIPFALIPYCSDYTTSIVHCHKFMYHQVFILHLLAEIRDRDNLSPITHFTQYQFISSV